MSSIHRTDDGSPAPERSEVLVMPGGVVTVTVFHFEGRQRSETEETPSSHPLWERLAGWVSGLGLP